MNKLMKKNQDGASLIETMVALFVLAIGLLGFAALLTNSLTMNQRAATLSQAMFVANNLAERIRMNRSEVAAYAITKDADPESSPPDCATKTCTATELVTWDHSQWFTLLESSLSEADATVTVTTLGDESIVTIKIEYALRLGRAGTGSAAEIASMTTILNALNEYEVRIEI